MSEHLRSGNSQGPVVVNAGGAEATFQRRGPRSAHLELAYDAPGLEADLSRASLKEGIEALCDAEVARMRATLTGLGNALYEQLAQEGTHPRLRWKYEDSEERSWRDQGTAFRVQPTVTSAAYNLTGEEGISEARWAQETVRTVIQSREGSIRKVYHQVLANAQAKRDGTPAPNRPSTEQ